MRGDIPDPDGNPCSEPHRAMVLLTDGTTAMVVGISSKFKEPPPHYWLKLPNAVGGDPVTGLTLPCVLKCNWVVPKPVMQLSDPTGTIPPEIYDRAVDLVLAEHEKRKTANQAKPNRSLLRRPSLISQESGPRPEARIVL